MDGDIDPKGMRRYNFQAARLNFEVWSLQIEVRDSGFVTHSGHLTLIRRFILAITSSPYRQ